MIGLESKKDEVTIPTVHLVEASAGNDVGIGQIEQPGRGQFLRTHVAKLFNAARQLDDSDVASLFEIGDFLRRGNIGGKIKNRIGSGRAVDFYVGDRIAIGDRTGQRVPCRVNVLERSVGIGRRSL